MMNKTRFFQWLVLAVVIALTATACTKAQEKAAQEKAAVIKLAENPWLSAELNTAVARILLEEEMGHHQQTTHKYHNIIPQITI